MPSARRNAEIACSRLLSPTAVSPQPAVTSASFETTLVRVRGQVQEHAHVAVAQRDRFTVSPQLAGAAVELEVPEGVATPPGDTRRIVPVGAHPGAGFEHGLQVAENPRPTAGPHLRELAADHGGHDWRALEPCVTVSLEKPD